MKIKDKIQALLRSFAYRQDYENYIASLPEGVTGCSYTYGEVNERPTGGKARNYTDHGVGANIYRDADADQLCQKYAIPCLVEPTSLKMVSGPLEDFFPAAWIEPLRVEGNKKIYRPTPDGVLTVKIDLTRNLDEIEKEVSLLYKGFQKSVDGLSSQKRERPSKFCPWEVFDLATEGLSFEEITIRLTHFQTKPKCAADNYENYKTEKRSVKRAHKKAMKLLAEFEGSISD